MTSFFDIVWVLVEAYKAFDSLAFNKKKSLEQQFNFQSTGGKIIYLKPILCLFVLEIYKFEVQYLAINSFRTQRHYSGAVVYFSFRSALFGNGLILSLELNISREVKSSVNKRNHQNTKKIVSSLCYAS